MRMFSLKQIACALTVSSACVAAQAATIDLGQVEDAEPFAGFIASAGPFNDILTFTLPPNLGTVYTVVNFPVSGTGFDFNTILNTLALFSNPDGILFNGDDVSVATSIAPGGESLKLSWGPSNGNHIQAGGNMYLNIGGIATGTTGGLYHGSINITPIPEPEVWAMMLIGVGLVGFRLRHRSKRVSAARFA